MYDSSNLETEIVDPLGESKCPVRGCEVRRTRQTGSYSFDKELYSCHEHRICISPSTFEYFDETDNMLWVGQDDLALWNKVKKVKRDKRRMGRERSEDAVTLNVFRHLEKVGLLPLFVERLTGRQCGPEPRLIFWSYCQALDRRWQPLLDACTDFGEQISPAQYSEPDVIIVGDNDVVFVEAKLDATNITTPSDPDNTKNYETGRHRWFHEVFQQEATFDLLANKKKLYELMRLWLIGSSVANVESKRFWLVNLVREGTEERIEKDFGKFLNCTDDRQFRRWSWEELFNTVIEKDTRDGSKMVEEYMKTKTLGYSVTQIESGERRKLKKAFQL